MKVICRNVRVYQKKDIKPVFISVVDEYVIDINGGLLLVLTDGLSLSLDRSWPKIILL